MIEQLDPTETRIIGCLLEKAVTTPDQYPLTLNALNNACNQKSSREPVMSLNQGEVQSTVRHLKEKRLVSIESGGRVNVEKYEQRFCNTLLGELKFDPAQYAIVCLLMLRGPQTPGELRSRSGRLHEFDDNQQVVDCLKTLVEREGNAIVARLPRKPGRMDHEYMHLFAGAIESAPEEQISTPRVSGSIKDQQIRQLEQRVEVLEKALIDLASRLGETIDLAVAIED
jgi:uncharacterized protein YceH (UPF0502 family)